MTWRPDDNTNEDESHSKHWLQFLDSLKEAPDEFSKAVVKRHRVFKRDRASPKPDNAFLDNGDAYVTLRTRRESSPAARHSPPLRARYVYFPEEDRRRRRERSSSGSSSGSFSRPREQFTDKHRESRDTSAASVSIDPSKAEDVTLHLSFPTAYDIEDALEEAARLRRIGHFKAAIEIYEQDLRHFLEIKYVMVQYAECLLEAGRISKFSGLHMKLPDSQPVDSLDLNWAFMKLRPEVSTFFPAHLQDVLDDSMKIIYRNWPRLDSTEVQLLKYSLDRISDDINWDSLYRHLRDEHMIWEFHDLFVSMASKSGLEVSWRRFFPRARDIPTSCLEQLDQDWLKEGASISTNFALLDILTDSGLLYLRVRPTKTKALECLEKAGDYAAVLRSQDASNVKSRPYLRWMVAKAMIEECPDRPWTLIENERGSLSPLFRGFMTPTGVFPDQSWPLYAPFDGERIQVVKAKCVVINKRLATIIKAAEEIGDLLLRTACLKELVLNGAEGTEGIMEKLEDLWTESGHADSVSQMHLYQYLLMQEPLDDGKVRRRILLDGETSTGLIYYTRCRVMAALATSDREREFYDLKAEDYQAARYRTRERSVSQERSRPHTTVYDSQAPHRSGGSREREESPNFPRPSDDQKRNAQSQESSLQTLRTPPTLAPTEPLTPKRLAVREQQQNMIIRSRENEAIRKGEDDATETGNASGGKKTDLIVTEYSSKNPVAAEHEDEDAKSDETEIPRPPLDYSDPEDEDLPRRDSIDILPHENAALESTDGNGDEGQPHTENNGTWS
ncbi:unnamed protein product [Clonostachys rosea f. rosea IK726]|uniref:Uncharacterized protein n=2 Tax=Bionectria ochroleuca TaxID=29856 RepID=A0A0B7KDN5_BIOOC|nr:unnamed protein product [Clonostachys rosea f. rosea IK726]